MNYLDLMYLFQATVSLGLVNRLATPRNQAEEAGIADVSASGSRPTIGLIDLHSFCGLLVDQRINWF